MDYLNGADYVVIGLYFSILVCLGLYLKRRASASLEDYLLGGRRLPWWALGISGMASFLDITGTMIIVSFLFMLGPRGLFIEFRGGAVLVLAVYLLWAGKWHRRSGCMTGAEWMAYRFGDGPGGQAARILRAVAEIMFVVGMLTYMVKGVGLFLSMFLPFSPLVCALIMIGVATVYTMVSGFYGVVFTDLFQSCIIVIAVVSISILAILKAGAGEGLANLAAQVTGSRDWLSSVPHWKTSMPKGYEAYQHLCMFAVFYLFRNIVYGMGTGDDPKYFGARSDRECGTLTFLWTWLMMFRWPMMMGFAVLGLFLVRDVFPDQGVLVQAAELIKAHVGDIDKSQWAAQLSSIARDAGAYPGELIAGLERLLGTSWADRLALLSYEGTVDPERILPAVILYYIPKGLRGMLLVALIAASMSTFDSTVNKGTGFFTRDLYQRYFRPKAANRELIYASWAFGFIVVAGAFFMAYTVENINDIWDWIAMGLGGGMVVPLFLRFYWWRYNGAGFAIGMGIGLCGCILQRALAPDLDPRLQFAVMIGVGLAGSLIGTYLTKPTDRRVLENFYRTTRPFGLWGPLKGILTDEARGRMQREHANDLLALPFVLCWQATLFLLPMQLIIGTYRAFAVTLVVFALSLGGMYWFWYRNLPAANAEGDG